MSLAGRAIGVAGALAAAQQALRIARTGAADVGASAHVIAATLRIDAASPADVYGGDRELAPMMENLRSFLASDERDGTLVRTLIALMQLERSFAARDDLRVQVTEGLRGAQAFVARPGGDIADAVPRLGQLYASTISQLVPRIMIPGDPQLLARDEVVTAVRAHLLAALRGTVLWHQMGGTRWNVWFSWRAIAAESERLARS